jgi:hypothetical protein
MTFLFRLVILTLKPEPHCSWGTTKKNTTRRFAPSRAGPFQTPVSRAVRKFTSPLRVRIPTRIPCPVSLLIALTVVPWVQSRVLVPPTSQMSNSESSSLEEQMPGRRQSCRECAIRQRVQRSTGLVHRVNAIWYVPITNGAFHLMVSLG